MRMWLVSDAVKTALGLLLLLRSMYQLNTVRQLEKKRMLWRAMALSTLYTAFNFGAHKDFVVGYGWQAQSSLLCVFVVSVTRSSLLSLQKLLLFHYQSTFLRLCFCGASDQYSGVGGFESKTMINVCVRARLLGCRAGGGEPHHLSHSKGCANPVDGHSGLRRALGVYSELVFSLPLPRLPVSRLRPGQDAIHHVPGLRGLRLQRGRLVLGLLQPEVHHDQPADDPSEEDGEAAPSSQVLPVAPGGRDAQEHRFAIPRIPELGLLRVPGDVQLDVDVVEEHPRRRLVAQSLVRERRERGE
mmetsp:Transcript_20201/g.40775  ORF Transcript_20201/g.40775 Transcript_20201/m.40775 type:complete len:300 (+) Transcript_20201:83-982(+)